MTIVNQTRNFATLLSIASALLFSTGTFAASGRDDHRDDVNWCQQYDGRPHACHSQPNCEYDFRADVCNPFDDGDPELDRQCYRFDRNPAQCERNIGCEYDFRRGRCEDQDSGGIGQDCSFYNRNPALCGRILNCYWDTRWNQCLDRSIH
jgi:hypothetical protein